MKHENVHNICIRYWKVACKFIDCCTPLFKRKSPIISRKVRGVFSTFKSDWGLVIWVVCSSASSTWPVTWHKVFYFKYTLRMHSTSLSDWKAHYSTFFKKLPIIQDYSWIFGPGLVHGWYVLRVRIKLLLVYI